MKWLYKSLGLVVLVVLPMTAKATGCGPYGSNWRLYNNPQLGIAFCHPPKLFIQTEGQEIYVMGRSSESHARTTLSHNNADLILNGKRMLEPSNYVVHIKAARGDFAAANAQEKIFVNDKGVVRAGIGRFKNGPAQVAQFGGWVGYKAEIICSTSDPKTGFHAAGGQCLWVVGSDGQHNFVLDTLGAPTDASTAWQITKSLRLLP